MKVIHLKRRGGKTTRAIALCKKTGAVLVVMSAMMKRWITKESPPESTLPEKQVVTFDEVREGLSRLRGIRYPTKSGMPEFVIDDADRLIQDFCPYGLVHTVTMSKPFSKAECKKMGICDEGSRT